MKTKPSDYLKIRYLKQDNIPENGGVFTITDFDEVDESDRAGRNDERIRLTFDERWWFELKGGNLGRVVEMLGDDFADWQGKQLGLCLAEFTTRDGETKDYIKVIPASEITRRPIKRQPASPRKTKDDDDERPFS